MAPTIITIALGIPLVLIAGSVQGHVLQQKPIAYTEIGD